MEQELLRVIDGICTIKNEEDESTGYEEDEQAEGEDGGELITPKETCIESLRDLQRLIRRDDPQKGTVKLLLGTMYTHGVVHKIIVPLITRKDADPILISACCKNIPPQPQYTLNYSRMLSLSLSLHLLACFLF